MEPLDACGTDVLGCGSEPSLGRVCVDPSLPLSPYPPLPKNQYDQNKKNSHDKFTALRFPRGAKVLKLFDGASSYKAVLAEDMAINRSLETRRCSRRESWDTRYIQ